MNDSNNADALLVQAIQSGDERAWQDLINRYEGRLQAFVASRIRNRAATEDIVQETFVGFLNSLPNYDQRRPLEGYLFSICAYKLTDHLRREGRRPTVSLSNNAGDSNTSPWQLVSSRARPASSIVRSGERRTLEEAAILTALQAQITKWKEQGDWAKLKCIELLFVVGISNKQVAERLQMTEQQVANFKFDFIARTKTLVGRLQLDEEVFPELASD
jgi:RNA polymerase sigma-70 factor, ECF subfamily